MKTKASVIVVFSLLFLSYGCTSQPADYWQINKPRILAIKSYSPQVTSEEYVPVEVLAYSPDGPISPLDIKWFALSVEDISLYSRGDAKVRLAGFFVPPIGVYAYYFPPVTPGTYWIGAILEDDVKHPSMKEIARVTEVTNRNPDISDVEILPSPVLSPDFSDDLTLIAHAGDPDGDELTYSWFVVDGRLTGCTRASEEWDVSGLSGYNQVFVVARDRKGGIDWKMAEIYRGDSDNETWLESGGMLYPVPDTSGYSGTITYSVSITRDSSERGFTIAFLKPVTGDTESTTLSRWYLGFTSCSPCVMRFRVISR